LSSNQLESLVERLAQGNAVALARLISWAENRDPRIGEVLRRVYPGAGMAYRIGITGPPGAGKSTLIARLAVAFRAAGERVAVIAVDPSSPFSGGALLGDRYRMIELSEDPSIFMRSMASRGALGGLAAATAEAMDLLDAAGFTLILVETVGVGQAELDIARTTDTVVLVLVPESGDGIQAMKAGLMEIGDLLVVNKADREGAGRLAGELESMLGLRQKRGDWRPEVLQTTAPQGEGIEELMAGMARHRGFLEESGELETRRRRTLKERLLAEAKQAILDRLENGDGEGMDPILDRLMRRELTPHDAAQALVDQLADRPANAPHTEGN